MAAQPDVRPLPARGARWRVSQVPVRRTNDGNILRCDTGMPAVCFDHGAPVPTKEQADRLIRAHLRGTRLLERHGGGNLTLVVRVRDGQHVLAGKATSADGSKLRAALPFDADSVKDWSAAGRQVVDTLVAKTTGTLHLEPLLRLNSSTR